MGFLKHRDSENNKPLVAKRRLSEPDPLPLAEMLQQPDPELRGVRIPRGLRDEVLSILGSKSDQQQLLLATRYLNARIDDYLLVERYRNALEMYEVYWSTGQPSRGEEG